MWCRHQGRPTVVSVTSAGLTKPEIGHMLPELAEIGRRDEWPQRTGIVARDSRVLWTVGDDYVTLWYHEDTEPLGIV